MPGRHPRPTTAQPGWGLGDVGIGLIASQVLSLVFGALAMALAGWQRFSEVPIWGLAVLQIPLWAGYLGTVWLAGEHKGNGVVADFGVRSTVLDAPIGLAIGIAAQLVMIPLLYLPILWATGANEDELSAPARELSARADGAAGWVVFALIVGLGAPVVEELFFRGLFLGALRKRGMAAWSAVLISSLVFAGLHFELLQLPGLFLFGVVAAVLTVKTSRLGPAIWAHIGFNLTTVLSLYLQR